MNPSISGVVKQISGYYKKMSKKKRIAVIATLSAVVVAAIVAVILLNQNSYTVLYRGLSSAEGAEVLDILDGLGAEYKVEADGTVYVLTKDEAVLKMRLASEGYPKSAFSYDIFTGASDLMTTDYEKRQYLVFQLQDRLQDSIKTLNGVRNAIVTLSVADDSTFVLSSDETESTASVVLDLYPSTELTKKQIKGIEELVAKSVSGLEPENVVIIDGDGTILNTAEDDSGAGNSYTQLELVKSINKLYEEKINSLLAPVLGDNGLSVSVNVVVDFTQKTKEETTYSPSVGDNGVISHHEYDNQSTNGGTVAGGVAGTESNTGSPTYEEGGTDNGSDKSASASGSTDYLVNQMVQTIIDYGGTINDMTVAVVINKSDLSEEMLKQYRQLIAYGTGISDDKVAITCAEFLKHEEEGDDTGNRTDNPGFSLKSLADSLGIPETIIYATVFGAALLFIAVLLVLVMIRRIARRRREKKSKALEELEKLKQEESAKAAPPKVEVPEIVLTETREQVLKKQVKEFTNSNPEIVAKILRSWIKEDNAK
jgi:flagellar M-ring protein FliF